MTPRYRVQPVGDRVLVLDTGDSSANGNTYVCAIVASYVVESRAHAREVRLHAHGHARRLNRLRREAAAFAATYHATRFERAKEAM